MRQPGHREGVRRHQRYGQTALDLGRTLDTRFGLDEEFDPDSDEHIDVGTCQRCGAYWDLRYFKQCPAPCGGYIG